MFIIPRVRKRIASLVVPLSECQVCLMICLIIKESSISSIRMAELRKVLMHTKELLLLAVGVMMVPGYLLVSCLQYTSAYNITLLRLHMFLTNIPYK